MKRALGRLVLKAIRAKILPTKSEDKAAMSTWVYAQDGENNQWTTSPLGMLNGLLRKADIVVSFITDETDTELLGFGVHRWSAYVARWGN